MGLDLWRKGSRRAVRIQRGKGRACIPREERQGETRAVQSPETLAFVEVHGSNMAVCSCWGEGQWVSRSLWCDGSPC